MLETVPVLTYGLVLLPQHEPRLNCRRSLLFRVPTSSAAHHGRWTFHHAIFRNVHVGAPCNALRYSGMWKHVPAA